jgi:glycosyltransferase involved in cell wall biosynthesis
MSRIAYYFSTFPALTTTFLQREVTALLDAELDVLLMANHAPKPKCYHPQDEKFVAQTFYLTPIKPVSYLTANLKWFVRNPRRYLKSMILAFGLRDNFNGQSVHNITHLLGAAVLAEYLVRNKVNHIHVHFAFGAASVAIFVETLTGIPYSLTIHGSDVLLRRPLTEEKLRRAKFVVSNCRFHIENLRRRYPRLSQKRFYVVRIGLDMTNGFWRNIVPQHNDPLLRILNVARLEPVKAQHVLIKACAELKNRRIKFHCRIVGDGPKRAELEALILKLGLHENVELMGKCYESEVSELYEWSHVVVLSSLSEGTPMTIIEAMAKARPAIAPDITALPEMILDGRTGYLFKPESVEDLTDKLTKFARHPASLATMGYAAHQRAKKLFDLKINAQKLLSILENEVPAFNFPKKANPS